MDILKQKATEVCDFLAKKSMTIATAESCTGGMIAELLTSVPGASGVFGYGFVTYSNEAKKNLLGVKEETLRAHGAVSGETVTEMAEGAMRVSGSDIAVSVSGIAGPTGGTKEKPVGLVYIGVAQRGEETKALRCIFDGDREDVRRKTVNKVYDLILNIR